jgi:hypothetical protein
MNNCNSNCKNKKIKIQGFSSIDWMSDSLGCLGYRNKYRKEIDDLKNEIKGASLNQIIELFGKPNKIRSGSYNYILKRCCNGSDEFQDSIDDGLFLRIYFNEKGCVENFSFVAIGE